MQHSPSNLIQSITTPNKGPNNQDVPSVQKSSGKMRGIDQMLPTIKNNLNEHSKIQKIPRIFPDAVTTNSDSSTAYDVERSDESMNMGGQTPQKHWKDIFMNVSQSTRQPFSPSISKLNSKELDSLEGILDESQTTRKCKRLYASLIKRFAGEHQQKRVAEARTLFDKLLYEKAKLQLKQLKLDQLSKKAQLCKVEAQECAKLKLIYSQLCMNDMKTTQNCESQFDRDSNSSNTSDEMVRSETETFEGYAFVNFTTPTAAWRLYCEMHKQRWLPAQSSKVCEITYARIQHLGGVYGLAFVDDNSIISAGEDACVRMWKLTA